MKRKDKGGKDTGKERGQGVFLIRRIDKRRREWEEKAGDHCIWEGLEHDVLIWEGICVFLGKSDCFIVRSYSQLLIAFGKVIGYFICLPN